MRTIRFGTWDCVLRWGRYRDNDRVALELVEEGSEIPVCRVSVNIPEEPLNHNQMIVKNIQENAGILEILEHRAILKRTERLVRSGFNTYHVCDLLVDPFSRSCLSEDPS